MEPSNTRTPDGTDRTLAARVVSLLQADLDAPAPVAVLAGRLGLDALEVQRALRRVFGCGVEGVVHVLRAERDATMQGAALLRPEAPSPEAASLHDAPAGLSLPPLLERLGPYQGTTVPLASVGPVAVTRALWSLVRRREGIAPYSMGVVTRAWGRGEGDVPFRCVRLHAPPEGPGEEAWGEAPGWYASAGFEGSVTGIREASTWLAATWVPRAGLRLAYGPLLVLVEGMPDWRGRVRASLHLAVAPLPERRPEGRG